MVIGALALAFALQAPPAQSPPQMPEVITRSRVDPNRGVDFHALVVPETVYVGQQATYQLGVFLDRPRRVRCSRMTCANGHRARSAARSVDGHMRCTCSGVRSFR